METTTREDTMARRTKLDIIREAIEINGHLPVRGSNGMLQIGAITGVARNGAWITDHLTSDGMAHIRLKKSAHGRIVAIAEDIISRRDEITARRERERRAFADR
jgi:hypothetical protein